MGWLITRIAKMSVFHGDFDNHLVRASMIFIFYIFGYQKWFDFEAQGLVPFFTHGPLIFWMYPVFGVRGSAYFLGVSEWLFGTLLLTGFWNNRLGILGGLGSAFTFLCTVTIIPFWHDGWAAQGGGFPAMTLAMGFLMKDVVLLAVSFYLLKHDLLHLAAAESATEMASAKTATHDRT